MDKSLRLIFIWLWTQHLGKIFAHNLNFWEDILWICLKSSLLRFWNSQNFAKNDAENVKLTALRFRHSVFCINAKTCSLRTLTKFFKRAIPENTLRNSFFGFTFSSTCTAPYRVSSGRAAGATVFCERGIYSLKKYEQQIGANVCADSVDEIQVSWCHRAAVWAVRRVAGEWHQISAWSESGSQQYSWKLLFSIWNRRQISFPQFVQYLNQA